MIKRETPQEQGLASATARNKQLLDELGQRTDSPLSCAVHLLGAEHLAGGRAYAYAWSVCGVVDAAAGGFPTLSVPLRYTLDGAGRVLAVDAPGDGPGYAAGIRRLFPQDLRERVLAGKVDVKGLARLAHLRA